MWYFRTSQRSCLYHQNVPMYYLLYNLISYIFFDILAVLNQVEKYGKVNLFIKHIKIINTIRKTNTAQWHPHNHITVDIIDKLTVGTIDQLTVETIDQLTVCTIDQLTVDSIDQLTVETIDQLTVDIIDKLTVGTIDQLTVYIIDQLTLLTS